MSRPPFEPPPPSTKQPPPSSSKPQARVRAATVRVRDAFVLARYGAAARDKYRAAASRALVETFTTSNDHWVDFGQFVESTEIACRLFAGGDLTLSREIGRFGAEHNVGVWRTLAQRLLSPATLLGIASGLWGHHYDGGRLVVRQEGATVVRLRIEDFPVPSRVHCLAISGWMHRTLELGRPKRLTFSETLCRTRGDGACEFVGDWA